MVYQSNIAMSELSDRSDASTVQERVLPRLLRVQMTLRDVLYISYAIPAGRLRPIVPDILPLATIGDDIAFISVVVLRSTRVRLSSLPFLRFNYDQLNIRTYVKDPSTSKHAIYFLRSGVTSRFISLVTRVSGIPWQFIGLKIDVDGLSRTNSYLASGNWEGRFSLKAQPFSDGFEKAAFFSNREESVDFLIRPLIGFIGDTGRLGRFTIQHPEVEPQSWNLTELDLPLFTNLGVVDELSNPHSVFYLPTADFSIYLPPRTIK
jgi:hypothetical protein